MPNIGNIVICPYYQSEDPLHIKCEGIVQISNVRTDFVMRFPSKEQKRQWQIKHCETYQYCDCPYAKMISEQYDQIMKSTIVRREIVIRTEDKINITNR